MELKPSGVCPTCGAEYGVSDSGQNVHEVEPSGLILGGVCPIHGIADSLEKANSSEKSGLNSNVPTCTCEVEPSSLKPDNRGSSPDDHVVADSSKEATGSKESVADVCEVGCEGSPSKGTSWWPGWKTLAAAAAITSGVTLLAAPVAVPAAAAYLGFQSTGIAAGSWAAGYMASYGGMVTAGSTCATLQAIGATGTFAGAGLTAATGAAVSASGVVLAASNSGKKTVARAVCTCGAAASGAH